jgi:hypothetical protein
MNVEIGTETPIFLFWEYLFRNFVILSLQYWIENGELHCTLEAPMYLQNIEGEGGGYPITKRLIDTVQYLQWQHVILDSN